MSLLVIEDGKITDSLSTVPIISYNDVTASRAFNTDYFNTSGRTLTIYLNVLCNTPNLNDKSRVFIYVNYNIVGICGIENGIAGLQLRSCATFLVPPGTSYRVYGNIIGNVTPTISKWIETY